MRNLNAFILCLSIIGTIACSTEKKEQKNEIQTKPAEISIAINPEHNTYHVTMSGYDTSEFNTYYENRIEPPIINLNQSLENKSLSELALLGNTILAMKGHLFRDAIFLKYFRSMPWYQPPYWDDNFTVDLNDAEKQFTNRIDIRVGELRKENLNDLKMANPKNIINTFQWDKLSSSANGKLSDHGFVIDKGNYNQLFEIYEQNKKESIPSFITTDLILQQMHVFYGTLENEIEEVYLTYILKSILEIINQELYASYEKTLDPNVERSIEENLLYYSIPYAVITNKKNNLIGSYNELYYEELGKVLAGEGVGSKIMGNDQLDYKIFKPTGHYTKNDRIQKYFKALTWLQKISLCLSDENDFSNAILIAYIINKKPELKNKYKQYIELKTYFSSKKEQFTLWNLAEIMSNIEGVKRLEDLYSERVTEAIKEKLNIVGTKKDCQLTVSLMPLEYQNLYTDLRELVKSGTSPSSIDLFAALGNSSAMAIFEANSEETEMSTNYLTDITENLVSISTQENALSMDWISTLLTSFNDTRDGPEFMNQSPWKRKELNTAMASWIKLNQRINLKAEGKRSTDNKPDFSDRSVLKGYVEPNIVFWNSAITILNNTKIFLDDRNMLSVKSSGNISSLIDRVTFLKDISEKEIGGISISDEEYDKISNLGKEVNEFTLKLINPNYNTSNQQLSGNDFCIAFATNIHAGGRGNNLIGGVGLANGILVIVEIEGYLYLTRGAVFSYYELTDHNTPEISQRQWKKILSGDNAPKSMSWMSELIEH